MDGCMYVCMYGNIPTEQILPGVIPVEGKDRRRMPRQVDHLISGLHVVQRNNLAVACCGEEFAGWGEGDGADGFEESYQRRERGEWVRLEEQRVVVVHTR